MKISDILKNRKNGVSLEFYPPKSEKGWRQLEETISFLRGPDRGLLYVSITETGNDLGTVRKLTADTVSRVRAMMPKIDIMPHITGRGLTEMEMVDVIAKYKLLGVENFFLLRGDKLPEGEVSLLYANQLVDAAREYSNDISIGVALRPEKHPESVSLEEDWENCLKKIEAGADFAITQFFLDNGRYYAMRDWFEKRGVTIPIIPGIMLPSNPEKFLVWCERDKIVVPEELAQAACDLKDDPFGWENYIVDFVSKQIRDLYKNGVRFFHLYTLNEHMITRRVLQKLGDIFGDKG